MNEVVHLAIAMFCSFACGLSVRGSVCLALVNGFFAVANAYYAIGGVK